MSTEEAAEVLGVHIVTVRRWLNSGELSGSCTPAGWRVTRENVQSWLDKYSNAKPVSASTPPAAQAAEGNAPEIEGLKMINVNEAATENGMSSCDFSDCIPALKALLGPQFHAEQDANGDWLVNYHTALAWAASYPPACSMVDEVIAAHRLELGDAAH